MVRRQKGDKAGAAAFFLARERGICEILCRCRVHRDKNTCGGWLEYSNDAKSWRMLGRHGSAADRVHPRRAGTGHAGHGNSAGLAPDRPGSRAAGRAGAQGARAAQGHEHAAGGSQDHEVHRASSTYESPARTGQPLAYFTRSGRDGAAADQLRVLTPADGAPSDFYYDGKTMTAFSPASKLVAVAPAPPTIDAMLKAAYDQAAIYFPFSRPDRQRPLCRHRRRAQGSRSSSASRRWWATPPTDIIAVANDTVQGRALDRRQGPPAAAVPGHVLPRARQFPPCRRAVELAARRARPARHVHGGAAPPVRCRSRSPAPPPNPPREASHETQLLGLAGLTLAPLPFEPAHAWFRGGAMGSVSGGGGSWDATGYRGGTASGGDGSWSGTGFPGGTASGSDGSWSGRGYRGGTASGGDGSWSGTGYRGGTASGGDGSWNANGADGGTASGGDGSWSGTGRYGNTAYGGYDHYNSDYYGGYHPPTVVNEYGSGCYNCGGWNTGGAMAAGAVGLAAGAAAGAAAGEATANVEASNAYAAGVAAGSAYTMNEVYPTLPPNCAYTPMGGGPYYNCAGTWFSPAYGANGAYYRVVPAP